MNSSSSIKNESVAARGDGGRPAARETLVSSPISQTRSSERGQIPEGASSNTPPLNTEPIPENITIPKQNQIVIDWLEITLPDDFRLQNKYHSLKHYIRILGAKFSTAPRGMNGYLTRIIYGKAEILMDGSEGMGVHIILSGQALRQMDNDPLTFLHWCLHHGGKVSRIDLALDDVSGELTLNRVKRAVRAGAASCKAKQYRHMESGKVSTGEITGETFYFGSAKSDTQYRIYDKAAEQGLEGHWVRCEGQYRHENAHRVAQLVHAAKFDIGPVFCGLLRGYLNFLKPSKTDSNKGRWKVASWWLNLLEHAEKIKLSVPKSKPSPEQKKEWFTKQVAPSMAFLFKYYGPETMTDIMTNGMSRLTQEQRELCAIPF